MPTPALTRHPFNPRNGLDATEVAMLAVANCPMLKIRRDEVGEAKAQAFAAGLIPDPQLSLGADFPNAGSGGTTTAFSLGLSEDLQAILVHSGKQRIARQEVRKINLELLWGEWQTVAKSRLLFDRIRILQTRQARLLGEQKALAPVVRHMEQALAANDLTPFEASTGTEALAAVRQQLGDTAITLHQATFQLRTLLGLGANAPLHLAGPLYLPHMDPSRTYQALESLPRRRPDLLALQAGYRAQDGRLRQAILEQFPAIVLGFNHARDTSNVSSNGFTVGITLPLFNRNRGTIAIAKATRRKLKDIYSARLVGTRNDMHRLQVELTSLEKQYASAAIHAEALAASRQAAEQAWKKRLLDLPAYLAIRSASLSSDMQALSRRTQIIRVTIALETLLGSTHLSIAQASRP